MGTEITAIEYYLPAEVLSTETLAAQFPEWPAEQVAAKTGIRERHIAARGEYASDLAYRAALQLFNSGACDESSIDMLLFCTQTPEYLLPSGACVLQERLRLSTRAGALDFNLGCSGYIYGLGMAHGFISSGQAAAVLLLSADTYSKLLAFDDKSTRTIFGDGAAATLITNGSGPGLGPFIYGTDGTGARHLMACGSGMRARDDAGDGLSLHMDGPELFSFAVRRVPEVVTELLTRTGYVLADIDLFVFHQANLHMLDHLRRKLRIPAERFMVALENCGNTVSSSIPIALKEAAKQERLEAGDLVMLVGFGVGFSWGATLVAWSPDWK